MTAATGSWNLAFATTASTAGPGGKKRVEAPGSHAFGFAGRARTWCAQGGLPWHAPGP